MSRVRQRLLSPQLGALAVACQLAAVTAGAQPPTVTPIVQNVYNHDPQAFTQGLVFWQGDLLESTGLYGRSSLRLVDIATGAIERQIDLPSSEFGEGLALVDDRLVQLTWKEGVANVYARDSFQLLGTFPYAGEGWGLCFDGSKLVMSDGSSSLFFRNAGTFELESSVSVERNDQLIRQLNELECVNGFVYANVWQTEEILKIDPQSGQVVATIRVRDLLTSAEKAGTDVLNGIAFNPDTRRFFVTGKLWPKLFEVEFPGEASPFFATDQGTNSTTASASSTRSNTSITQAGYTTTQAAHTSATGNTLPPPARVASGCHCGVAGAKGADGVAVAVGVLMFAGYCLRRRRA
jgi:glutaminyl-peptide cyclotransferase